MAQLRASVPVVTGSAADFIPPKPTLSKLRGAARGCRGCHLWMNATQTVFGEGPRWAARAPDDEREGARRKFVADLKTVATYLRRRKAKVAGSQ